MQGAVVVAMLWESCENLRDEWTKHADTNNLQSGTVAEAATVALWWELSPT